MDLRKIKDIFKEKGYSFFTEGDYNLNIFAYRNNGSRVTNRFTDTICVVYKEKGNWRKKEWSCTTRAGLWWMLRPMNKNGTAILTPKQHRSAFKFGYHKGKYKALVQARPIEVYRDNNKNEEYDPDKTKIYKGWFGIHIHKAGYWSKIIRKWSAGCIVFQRQSDFNEFINICEKASAIWGDVFSFTIFEK